MSKQSTATFDRATFDKIVAGITRSGAAYTKGIGQALLGALYFSIVEQSAEPANALVAALRKSTKQAAIIALLQDNGNLAWCTVGRKTASFEFFDAMQTWLPDDVAALRTVCEQWEDYKPAKVAKDYDAIKAIEQIIKNVKAKVAKGEGVIGADILPFLESAMAQRTAKVYGEAV